MIELILTKLAENFLLVWGSVASGLKGLSSSIHLVDMLTEDVRTDRMPCLWQTDDRMPRCTTPP